MNVVLSVFQFVGILCLVVLVFNVLILVHEWGHFLAARWRGLQVDKFQIWFGKPLWSKKINGVQYGLGTIPAGGFVALPQMAPMETIEGKRDGEGEDGEPVEELPPIGPLDKTIVAIAGPLFSFGLAIFFALIVWVVGYPVSDSVRATTIGYVEEGSKAWEAGLRPGDEVKKVDGVEVTRFHGMVDSVTWHVVASEGETIPFEVVRDGQVKEFEVEPVIQESKRKGWWWKLLERPQLRQVAIDPRETPMVARVYPNSPAEKAGIRKNDLVVGLNGAELLSRAEIVAFIDESPGEPMQLQLDRDGAELAVELTPEIPENKENYMLGVGWDHYGKRVLDHPNPYTQIKNSLRTMVNTLGAVFSPKSDISAGHLSGPAGIMRLYYNLFKHPDGWRLVLWFSVILNVNLAILNMLPFPILDGGHITMAAFEAIRRKPMNIRMLEVVQTGCALLLIGFMIFVTMKDAGDMVGAAGGGGAKAGEPVFSTGESAGGAGVE